MKHSTISLAAKALALGFVMTSAQTACAANPANDNSVIVQKFAHQNALLEKQVSELQQQMEQIKQQLLAIRQQSDNLVSEQQQHAKIQQQMKAEIAQVSDNASQVTQQVAQQAATQSALAEAHDKLSLWGYGELYYTQPTRNHNLTQADLARAVFGIGYQFDEATRFNSEFEIEHAVASASDPGEFEVEQFYVDHKINDKLALTAGLFLIPAGFLNENHEPTNYYGVQRNFVETLIIPSTWREGGIALHGNIDSGITWNAGITTGLDLSKWNFTPASPPYRTALELEDNDVAPMQASHQELALANGKRLSEFVALNYRGMPGMTLGGAYFAGGVAPAVPGIPDNERVALWETHARYQPGKLDLQALYARGALSNTGAANALFPGASNPIPSRFDGWFAQAAYNVWQQGSYRLSPFARHERYDMGAAYDGIASGTGAPPSPAGFPAPRDTVDTIGANFYLNPNVVFKIDYQKFRDNTDFSRVDLGMGLQF